MNNSIISVFILMLSHLCLFSQRDVSYIYSVKILPQEKLKHYPNTIYLDYKLIDSIDYIPVFIVNNSSEEISMRTYQGKAIVDVELQDNHGKWVDRDTLPTQKYAMCGTGLGVRKIPKQSFSYTKMNKYYGSFSTLARYKLAIEDSVIYSKPFMVTTNPNYFGHPFYKSLERLDNILYSKKATNTVKYEAAIEKIHIYLNILKEEKEALKICRNLLADFPNSAALQFEFAKLSVLLYSKENISDREKVAIICEALSVCEKINTAEEQLLEKIERFIGTYESLCKK